LPRLATHMATTWQSLMRQSAAARFVDATLRGASQVMFQDNAFTGLLFLAAVLVGSLRLGAAGLIGLAISTLAATWLGADRAQVRAGVFGFNGLLVGIALAFFFRFDAWLLGAVVFGSALAAVLMLALGGSLRAFNVPPLTAPFVLTLWLLLLAAHQFPLLLRPALPHALPEAAGAGLTLATLVTATLRGLGQVLFQDSAGAGLLFLLAIGINSRLSAAFAALGSVTGVLTAVALGGHDEWVRHGVYGFNAAMCAVAVGGLLFVLTWRAAIFALAVAVVSTVLMVWMTALLAPMGRPALSAPFTLTVWSSLLLRPVLRVLRSVPLAEITTPEQIRQAFLPRSRA
jgi:urea transporter